MQAVFGHEGQEAKAARVQRWKDGITSTYPDGTESTWFSGPIEDYVPPGNIKQRLEVAADQLRGTEHGANLERKKEYQRGGGANGAAEAKEAAEKAKL